VQMLTEGQLCYTSVVWERLWAGGQGFAFRTTEHTGKHFIHAAMSAEYSVLAQIQRRFSHIPSRYKILKKRGLMLSAAVALLVAGVLAGCGGTNYFDGRVLPPSGLTSRVLIAIQNPSAYTRGALQFVDSYYDIRYSYDYKIPGFPISGYAGSLPITIQSMPEEQLAAVYGSGDGGLSLVSYASEKAAGSVAGLNGLSSSVFITRNQAFAFAASQSLHVVSVADRNSGASYALSLPGVYRVSVNPGGSVALFFVQNSNYVYYPMKLTAEQQAQYAGGPSNWPKAAVDCEPQNLPGFCLYQAQDNSGTALTFDRPTKAVFSADGSTAYVLNCGPECGGTASSYTPLPISPMIFINGQASGVLPSQDSLTTVPIPGGASNALVSSSTMYVVGQELMPDGYWGGHLTVVDLASNTASPAVSISDGVPMGPSRIIQADDNTLWVGMTKCTNGERANNPSTNPGGFGCLTMYNTSTRSVTMLESYIGDLTGIAAVTGLHKIYVAQGGQVYIYSTVDGTAKNNQYVTVVGTAMDVAYMDAITDGNNTVY
jgi:hypothetical protein